MPQPLGPTSTANDPSGISTSTPRRMALPPKAFCTPRTAHRIARGAARSLSMGVSTAAGVARVEAAVMAPGFDMVARAYDSGLSD